MSTEAEPQPQPQFHAHDGTLHASPYDARVHALCDDAAVLFGAHRYADGSQAIPLLMPVLKNRGQRDMLIALLVRHGFAWAL